jgi:hypothetical protein
MQISEKGSKSKGRKKGEKERDKKDRILYLKFRLVVWLIFVLIGGIVSLVKGEIWYLIAFAAFPPAFYLWLRGAG